MKRGPWLPLLVVTAGCFSYVPAEPAAVPEGERVRVHLTRSESLELPELADQSGPVLRGTIARKSADQVWLRVPVVVRRDGMIMSTLGQDVALPLDRIDRLETRTLNVPHTGLMVAGTVGLAAFVVLEILDGAWFREPPGPGGGSDLGPPRF